MLFLTTIMITSLIGRGNLPCPALIRIKLKFNGEWHAALLRGNTLKQVTWHLAAGPCLFRRWPPSWQPPGSQDQMLVTSCCDGMLIVEVCNIVHITESTSFVNKEC